MSRQIEHTATNYVIEVRLLADYTVQGNYCGTMHAWASITNPPKSADGTLHVHLRSCQQQKDLAAADGYLSVGGLKGLTITLQVKAKTACGVASAVFLYSYQEQGVLAIQTDPVYGAFPPGGQGTHIA